MRLSQFAASVATLTTLLAAGASRADIVLFDNISPYETGNPAAGASATGSSPNTFMGAGVQLTAGATQITGFDLFPVNISGTNFTGLKVTVYVWDNVNTGTVNATTPAFSNLLTSITFTTTGTFNTGFFYPFESATPGVTPGVTLTTPLNISDETIGLTFNYQGTTDGTTYNNVNSLTSLITYGVAPTVGTNIFNGYYRNANSETDGNFTSTLRSLGQTNQGLGVRVYGVPTPGATALLSLGGLVSLRRRRR